MKKKKENPKNKEKQLFKCYKCGYISSNDSKYCPRCQLEELFIRMQPYIEK